MNQSHSHHQGNRNNPTCKPSSGTNLAILILGMHRSGTSAVTRVASLFGGQLPTHLMKAGVGNETGHWESQKLADYHDSLLSQLNSAWYDWRPLKWEQLSAVRLAEIRDELWRLLQEEYGDHSPFTIKDPRICRFAALFLSVLEENGVCTKVIIPFRNPLEVIHSLQKRDDMHRVDAAMLWLRHNLDCEKATRGYQRSFLDYDHLMADWRQCWRRISDDLQGQWSSPIEDAARKVDRFINPNQRHHRHGPDDVKVDPLLNSWIATVYDSLAELERNPNLTGAQETLDDIGCLVEAASPILFQALAELRRSHESEKTELRRSHESEKTELRRSHADRLTQTEHRFMNQLQHENQRILTKDRTIEAMRNSYSWRITRPLRKLKRRVK